MDKKNRPTHGFMDFESLQKHLQSEYKKRARQEFVKRMFNERKKGGHSNSKDEGDVNNYKHKEEKE